ncbi:T-cell surface glycoprotein CD3 delta chain isoform X2 [Leopardus geoffroyi]|uniref:T-cell surface glycoprotein CD3 delta chain n=1 Tax=Acinonyx jubatus TaxID=32536 RepID=A0A6I9ZGE4_ACIJB|nr:T-cell surface glycoprotein CD3 delta chain isoform X2 [Acinonyx jubatus]XP_045338960.1 T-cell surface glycoprotein CD3 delta chain isoform X2 [Leopardus geoffroyi]
MEHSSFLAGLILSVLLSQVSPYKISVEELEDKVLLSCNTSIIWMEGTMGTLFRNDTNLDLGKRILDPRGVYTCKRPDEQDKIPYTQVYYRTADTQALLGNDQLYQPLRDRNDAQYSHLGENWPRKK